MLGVGVSVPEVGVALAGVGVSNCGEEVEECRMIGEGVVCAPGEGVFPLRPPSPSPGCFEPDRGTMGDDDDDDDNNKRAGKE